ncbi:hypothetical protein NEIFLAOT_01546 [Neisseria flavescens NRL30031/H210]|uniref:Uncharacterized protein n=1 Tax=Neisseria flavescens NRL30031/H210 TaxID=546264 RepID=C0ENL1_NEIFL|nr:hypothetical protein NEIFLAOT_01546 [Neisseria flavescens NRL30031/H210]
MIAFFQTTLNPNYRKIKKIFSDLKISQCHHLNKQSNRAATYLTETLRY